MLAWNFFYKFTDILLSKFTLKSVDRWKLSLNPYFISDYKYLHRKLYHKFKGILSQKFTLRSTLKHIM